MCTIEEIYRAIPGIMPVSNVIWTLYDICVWYLLTSKVSIFILLNRILSLQDVINTYRWHSSQ